METLMGDCIGQRPFFLSRMIVRGSERSEFATSPKAIMRDEETLEMKGVL